MEWSRVLIHGPREVRIAFDTDRGDVSQMALEIHCEGELAASCALARAEVPWLADALISAWNWAVDDFQPDVGVEMWRGGDPGDWGPDMKRRSVLQMLGKRRVFFDFSPEDAFVEIVFAAQELDADGPRHTRVVLKLWKSDFEHLVDGVSHALNFAADQAG